MISILQNLFYTAPVNEDIVYNSCDYIDYLDANDHIIIDKENNIKMRKDKAAILITDYDDKLNKQLRNISFRDIVFGSDLENEVELLNERIEQNGEKCKNVIIYTKSVTATTVNTLNKLKRGSIIVIADYLDVNQNKLKSMKRRNITYICGMNMNEPIINEIIHRYTKAIDIIGFHNSIKAEHKKFVLV